MTGHFAEKPTKAPKPAFPYYAAAGWRLYSLTLA